MTNNSLGQRIMRHVASLSLIYLLRLTNFCLISSSSTTSSSTTTSVLVATYICVFSSSSMHVVADAESGQQQQQQQQHQQQQPPMSVGKLRSLGEVALSERRYADAESLYLRAIKIEPDNALNHHKLYAVRKRRGGGTSLSDALVDISRAVDLDPSRYDYRVQKAALLVHLGRCDEAYGEYVHAQLLAGDDDAKRNAAIEGARDSGECARELSAASEAHRDGRWEDAVRHFDAVLGRTLDAPDLLFLKANAEFRSGDYYGTVSDTGRILKNYPKHIEAYQLRGGAYARLNEMDMAVKHYREGLKLDPEHKGECVFVCSFVWWRRRCGAVRCGGRADAMCNAPYLSLLLCV